MKKRITSMLLATALVFCALTMPTMAAGVEPRVSGVTYTIPKTTLTTYDEGKSEYGLSIGACNAYTSVTVNITCDPSYVGSDGFINVYLIGRDTSVTDSAQLSGSGNCTLQGTSEQSYTVYISNVSSQTITISGYIYVFKM